MAEKDSKPKSTSKTTTTTKPAAAAKPASAKPAAKPATAKTAAPAKPAAKTAAPKAEAKPAPKAAPKEAAKTTATPKAKTEAKPAKATPPAKSEPKPAPTKTAAKSEPKPKAQKAEAKPAAKPVAESKAAPKAETKKSETAAPKEQPAKVKTAASTTNKKEKATKAKTKESGKKGGAAALTSNKKRFIAIAVVAFVMILALVIGIMLGVRSCANRLPVYGDTDYYNTLAHYTTTTVGYSAKTTGKVKANKPVAEVRDESAAFDVTYSTSGIFANGAARYPTYGSTLRHVIGEGEAQVTARNAIIAESGYLCAWGTAGANNGGEQTPDKYTKIDKNGYLWQKKDGEWIHSLLWGKTAEEYTEANYRQLYKHTAAQGMYMEGYTKNDVTYEISDNAERVVKQVNMKQRGYGYGITGLYAPAGEVVKVELSGKDMNATGGITVHIGQALYNGQANNIWASKNQMQRFPYLLTTLQLNKETCDYDEATDTWTGYIGSFIGGPIYIRNNEPDFTAKISGGVEYLHFILGYTTEAEYNRLKKTSRVPMYDLEVWDRGVLFSGPRYYAEPFSYEDIYKAAVLWDKVASVTTTNSNCNTGIVFLFDPFVAAGAAVAFPGRSSVNCPAGWMPQTLNYEGLVTSGSWGNFHEYHHNFQNYGVGYTGEVTNNGLNLVSYSLFTKISSKRGMGSYGGQGLGGWNNYTSATWATQRMNNGLLNDDDATGYGLAVYATLLHNLGQDAYVKTRGASGSAYYDKWATVTHQDMTYYAGKVSAYGGAYTPSDAVKNANYPLFVPVSSVYQTGRSYLYDGEKRDIKTMQPYVIPYGKEFTVDLRPYTAPNGQYASGSVVIGNGFTYKIKDVTQPSNGKLEKTDTEGVYTYTPDKKNKSLLSGQIRVTLEIYNADDDSRMYNGHALEDVDLILEFEQSHETNKMTLERTTYTYTDQTMYKDAVEAYEKGFKGYESVVEQDQFNPTQNCNTDIWFYPVAEKPSRPNAPDKYFFHDNNIEVIDGKLYFDDDGKYRVYLRGRNNCALYFSLDGKDYTLGARITQDTPTNGATANFRTNAPDTYFDIEFNEGKVNVTLNVNGGDTKSFTLKLKEGKKEIENWLFIKEVLIVEPSVRSFIGVGMSQWTQAMFTVEETYYTSDDKMIGSAEVEGYAYTKTTYKNYLGVVVAYTKTDKKGKTEYFEQMSGQSYREISSKEFSKLTESKLIAPTSANYVNAYRSTYEFNAEFTSEYFYKRNYTFDYKDNVHTNPEQTLVSTNYAKGSSWNWTTYPAENLTDGDRNTFIHTNRAATADKPFEFVVDMGEEKTVNRMTIYTQYRGGNNDWLAPKDFTLLGSLDGNEFFTVGEFINVPRSNTAITVDFEDKTFRYYKLTVTRSDRLLMIGEIEMWHMFQVLGGTKYTPDNETFTYKGKWSGMQTDSTFGHVAIGASGAKMTFEFTGTRIALLSSNAYGKSFKVYIDGKKVDSVALKEDTSPYGVSYMSGKLAQGKH
ncbi:MAG: M60 family metallopeptidase, partial [Clostridia bacterium]|nr:M60 family metallopeptidase [Clostridia bacterium]